MAPTTADASKDGGDAPTPKLASRPTPVMLRWHARDRRVRMAETETLATTNGTGDVNGAREQIEVENPATGEVAGSVPRMLPEDVAEMVSRAARRSRAGRRWASPAARACSGARRRG